MRCGVCGDAMRCGVCGCEHIAQVGSMPPDVAVNWCARCGSVYADCTFISSPSILGRMSLQIKEMGLFDGEDNQRLRNVEAAGNGEG